ncbi:MAG: hypothetical protein LBK94_02785, partial [Prevotellaceae bacterium]|nr:hypothetical protein [Prevotellaceae bacterium]
EDGDVKHQIANVIRPIARSWHFQSLKEYKALLTLYNTGMEEIRGEINSKPYQGLVYFALDSKGEKLGNPFKSSLFGKSVGIDALEKRIKKSAEIIKNKGLKERSKDIIYAAMQTCKTAKTLKKRWKNRAFPCCFVPMRKVVFMALHSSIMRTNVCSTARVWARNFPLTCSMSCLTVKIQSTICRIMVLIRSRNWNPGNPLIGKITVQTSAVFSIYLLLKREDITPTIWQRKPLRDV